ncbi:hypothetical protein BD809_1185 [Aquimarina intermedia]|uniref:Uncharacterized protein n=1 Tax=Aquimarina intermedia TaxID=350814 RepID=A0A5S5BTR2_9FLAO|nr:hypothetical protein BD809_1185 [Aquimarina intermedia]
MLSVRPNMQAVLTKPGRYYLVWGLICISIDLEDVEHVQHTLFLRFYERLFLLVIEVVMIL